MIDCHTHLASADFHHDREAVMERAFGAGLLRIAVVGQDAAENRAVLALTRGDPRLMAFMGLHPDRFADRAEAIPENDIALIEAEIRAAAAEPAAELAYGLTGIGEVGLDYRVCESEPRRELQREAFCRMIRLARELGLPLNVHARSAGHYAIDLLLREGAERVLMHAFDGRASHALRGAEAGFLFSVPPSIVRSPQKQKLVRALPLESLALETDSPVLGPERGSRNEPANVAVSASAIAEIKALPEQEVRLQTTRNAARLLGLSLETIGAGEGQ